MSFGPCDPHNIEIDEFLKLDFNRVIDQLKVENEILKRRLEVMESHIGKHLVKAEAGKEVGKEEGNVDVENEQMKEQKIDQLLRSLEIYKNETICLKNFIENLTEKFNLDNKYLLSQITLNVETLKKCEDENVRLREKVTRYQTALDDQQLKTMACFKYLQQMKTKYEDKLEQQQMLIRLLDDRFKRYFADTLNKTRDGQQKSSSREQKLIPENWGLQEKIEYLELKFINENRDKILNRLLFENEQLRNLIENDFCESSEFHGKKRIKTSEDYYLDYLRRDSKHNRLMKNEMKRLSNQKNKYTEWKTIGKHEAFTLDNDESNGEENATDEGVEEEQSESDEDIADNEEDSTSNMSDEIIESVTDLKELVETFREAKIYDEDRKQSDQKVNDKEYLVHDKPKMGEETKEVLKDSSHDEDYWRDNPYTQGYCFKKNLGKLNDIQNKNPRNDKSQANENRANELENNHKKKHTDEINEKHTTTETISNTDTGQDSTKKPIQFKYLQQAGQPAKHIEIKRNASLNKDKDDGTLTTNNGNNNKQKKILKY